MPVPLERIGKEIFSQHVAPCFGILAPEAVRRDDPSRSLNRKVAREEEMGLLVIPQPRTIRSICDRPNSVSGHGAASMSGRATRLQVPNAVGRYY